MIDNKRKIIVKYQGGLGNQLFEYAFCRWLKSNYPAYCVHSDLSYYKIRMAHEEAGIWDIFSNIQVLMARW